MCILQEYLVCGSACGQGRAWSSSSSSLLPVVVCVVMVAVAVVVTMRARARMPAYAYVRAQYNVRARVRACNMYQCMYAVRSGCAGAKSSDEDRRSSSKSTTIDSLP